MQLPSEIEFGNFLIWCQSNQFDQSNQFGQYCHLDQFDQSNLTQLNLTYPELGTAQPQLVFFFFFPVVGSKCGYQLQLPGYPEVGANQSTRRKKKDEYCVLTMAGYAGKRHHGWRKLPGPIETKHNTNTFGKISLIAVVSIRC